MRKVSWPIFLTLLITIILFSGCNLGDGGSIQYRDGTYEGELKNDSPHGTGTAYHPNGIIAYEGEFKEGLPHGKGKVYYQNGNLGYEGEIKEDMRHGEGTLYYESGSIRYEGGWKEDLYHGFGIKYFDEGVTWEDLFNIDESFESPYEDETIMYKGEWIEGEKQDEIIDNDIDF